MIESRVKSKDILDYIIYLLQEGYHTMDFIEAFVEIYNVEASAILIFFCGLAILKLRKLSRDLLRARLFLNNAILEKTWIYISIGIAFLALSALIKFVSRFSTIGAIPNKYYMIELTQVIFLTAFSLSVYSCYLFINSTVKNSSAIVRKSNPT